jgi:polyisoprenoid-binding protein YceI
VSKAIIAPIRASGAGQVSAQTGSVDDFAKAEGGALAVEPFHTRVLFVVSHFGFTNYYGEFSGVSGALDFDPKNPSASKLEIQIPVASIHGAGVNPLNKRYTVGFDASAKIKRTEFGVSTYVPLVSDDVDIIISAAFERQSGKL